MRPHQFGCEVLSTKKTWTYWSGAEEITKMMRGIKLLSSGDKLRELGWFSLDERNLWGDLIAVFNYLKG